MTTLAGTIITRVRDLVPDPIYSGMVPQPDADGGLFRASSLYGWLDDGVKLLTATANWTMSDWFAAPLVETQPIYAISPLWGILDQVYVKQRAIRLLTQNREAEAIYPERASGPQANMAYSYRSTDHLDIGIEPVPSLSSPTATLAVPLTATTDTLVVSSADGFLSYGFVRVDAELIQYQSITNPTLFQLTRGAGGTLAAAHASGVPVFSCELWIKGLRAPTGIATSASPVEVPLPWVSILNSYLLAQCLESQQETQRAMIHQRRFDEFLKEIGRQVGSRDPISRQPQMPEPPGTSAPMPMPAAAQLGG